MQLELHTWKITGLSPLIQNNPCEMWATPDEDTEMKTGSRKRKPMYPGDTEAFKQAKRSLYVNDDGNLYHPAASFMNSLFDACAKRYFGKAAALGIIVMAVRIVDELRWRCRLCQARNTHQPIAVLEILRTVTWGNLR